MQPIGIAKLDAPSAPQLGQMGAERMVKKNLAFQQRK